MATNELPRQTTPTWEIELLMSGALVFSLLQLPALLDVWMLKLLLLAPESFRGAVLSIAIYLRTALLGLSVAFVVHLVIRAFWVALVGVHSVFPGGTRWERIHRGPITLQYQQRSARALPERIEATDNLASIVFAAGVGMGTMMLSLAVTVGLLTLVAGVFGHFQLLHKDTEFWLLLLLSLLLGPQILATLVDRWLGARLSPGGRGARWIELGLAQQRWIPGMSVAMALINPLVSNVARRGALTGFVLLMSLALGVAAINLPSFSSAWLRFLAPATDSPWLSTPVHYRDQRRGLDRFAALPSIASRELGDTALELFLPLRADRHPQALRAECPKVTQRADPDRAVELLRQRELLQCAHRLFAPQLDGQALPGSPPEPIFSVDALSGQEGLLWRVDNALIGPGRHVLQLRRIPAADQVLPVAHDEIVFFR